MSTRFLHVFGNLQKDTEFHFKGKKKGRLEKKKKKKKNPTTATRMCNMIWAVGDPGDSYPRSSSLTPDK